MHFHDQVPVELAHFLEANVTQDASVVDNDINSAKGIDSSLDNLVTELHGVFVCDSDATCGLDFVDNDISGMLGISLVFSLD